MLALLPWAAALAAATALAIAGKHRRSLLHYICKPAAMGLVIALYLTQPSALPDEARPWMLAALFLSLAGDVLLMWPRGFLPGLVSFLLAHVAYIVCFTLEAPLDWPQLALLPPPLLLAAWLLVRLWPHLGKLRPAVALYAVALSLSAWRLLARLEAPEVSLEGAVLGAVGASAFVLSDGVLALRRFAKLQAPYGIELSSYMAAQLCIVAGTLAL